MTNRPGSLDFLNRLSGSIGRCIVVLSAVTVIALAVIGTFAHLRSGTDGLIAACAAVVVCWTGAVLALLVSAPSDEDPSSATSRLLLSIVFRTAIPFGGALALSSIPRLAEAGVFGMTVAMYLVTLAAETVLSLGLLNRSATTRKAS